MLLLDTLGKRYGLLPSQVMQTATTFDVFILDAAIGYEAFVNDKHKQAKLPKEAKPVTDEKMLQALEEFKKKK